MNCAPHRLLVGPIGHPLPLPLLIDLLGSVLFGVFQLDVGPQFDRLIHGIISAVVVLHYCTVYGLFVSGGGYSINLRVKSLQGIIAVKWRIPIVIRLLGKSAPDLLWGVHFHVGDLNIFSLVLVLNAVFVVLPCCWHVLGNRFQKALVQIPRFVFFKRQVLLVCGA